MELNQNILMEIQTEINYLVVKNDLTHLPKVAILLDKYCSLNDIDHKDLDKLKKLYQKYY